MSAKKPLNDVVDFHNAGGDSEQLRQRMEGVERLPDDILERVAGGQQAPASHCHARIVRLADVEPVPIEWLWPNRIPFGHLTLVEGDPGVGKSTAILADLTARVTTGGELPGGGRIEEPGNVILLTAEDGLADTILPRLIAAGADLSRVHAIEAITEGEEERFIDLTRDLRTIEEAVRERDARLVVIDPLNAYIGAETNAHRDDSIRRVLSPLSALAERTIAALVGLRHWTKTANGNAKYRGLGSIGYTAAARSVIAFAPDPDDSKGTRFVMAVAKTNVGIIPSSLSYSIEPCTVVDGKGNPIETSRIAWLGESHHMADDLCREPESHEERTALDEAVEFLRAELADGPVPVKELQNRASQDGISKATLRRAKEKAGVSSKHNRKPGETGPTYWQLSEPEGEESPSDSCRCSNSPVDAQTQRVNTHTGGEHLQAIATATDTMTNQSPTTTLLQEVTL